MSEQQFQPFQLGVVDEDALEVLTLYCNRVGHPVKDPTGADDVHEIQFWIRPLLGKDQRVIANNAQKTDKRGVTWIQNGEVQREIVTRSVVKIDGLLDARGNPVTKMDYDVADKLPKWMADEIVGRIVDVEVKDEPLLGESEG